MFLSIINVSLTSQVMILIVPGLIPGPELLA